jgi:hypothetical protein
MLEESRHKERVGGQLDCAHFAGKAVSSGAKTVLKEQGFILAIEPIAAVISLRDSLYTVSAFNLSSILKNDLLALLDERTGER